MLTDVQLGEISVRMALGFPRWIERRVERVAYMDRATTRWAVGVMFRWPEDEFPEGSKPREGDVVYVPLDLLTKNALASLDGMSPDGSPFPILPYPRTTRLAYLGIVMLLQGEAEKEPGVSPPNEKTRSIVEAVVAAPPDRAAKLLNTAFADSSERLHSLPNGHPVRTMLEDLKEHVMLLVPIVYRPGEEAVYRYTYSAASPKEPPLKDRLRDRFLFRDIGIKHRELPFGLSGSYHFEVQAPTEVRIPRAFLVGSYRNKESKVVKLPVAEAAGDTAVDLHARRPTQEVLDHPRDQDVTKRPPLLPRLPDADSTQLWLDAARDARPSVAQRDDRGRAEVWFRLQPQGTFLVTAVIGFLTALLLIAATIRLEQLEGSTGAALLLALPGITLGALSKPGEHSFARGLLFGIRTAGLIIGLCSLWVAWLLAGGFVEHHTAAPTLSCTSHLQDVPVHPTPHHTWQTTRDPDRSELACASGGSGANATHAGAFATGTSIAATAIAGLAAVWLVVGLLRAWRRGDALLPPQELADAGPPRR